MNSEYIWIGNKHINSFGNASQFWADYYYKSYRDGTKMFYRLKARMTYTHTQGGSGTYADPVVAIFRMNYNSTPSYNATKQLKPTNNGTMYSGYYWEVESDWFSLDKTTGSINCFISVNNSITWAFDNPDYYFSLNVIPALSTISLNNGVYFDVDTNENVPKIIPALLTKYDNTYTTKLKISLKNNNNEITTIREYEDFNSNEFSFTVEELSKIYNATPNWKMFILILELETFTSDDVSLGVYTDNQPAKISDIGIKPTFNDFTYSDNNPITYELTGDRSILIKGYSNPRLSVAGANEATAHKGASVIKYTFINGEQSKDYVLGEYPAYADLIGVKDRTLIAWAIDSREESTKAEKIAIEWVDYSDIEKISFSAERKDGGTSTQVTLKLDGKIWNGNFGAVENSIKSAIYKYKKTTDGEDDWVEGTTDLIIVKDGDSYSLEQDIVGDLGATGFDQEESYDIYVEVSDQLSTAKDTFTLGAGSPAQAIYKNNIALGSVYDEVLGGRVQIPKITGATNFETNLLKQGKEVATIDSGTNNNGNWIKFSDGTMICRAIKTITTGAWSQTGSSYYYDYETPIVFPQEFISDEDLSVEISSNNSAYVFLCQGVSYDTSEITKVNLLRPTVAGNGAQLTISYIAIGKWK